MTFNDNSKNIINIGIKALEEKKASNIKVIDISKISVVADAIVIASGSNDKQIQAMSDEIERKLSEAKIHHMSIEGYDKANWILIDYNDVIFHLFDHENRNFYDLDRLYADGEIISNN